MPETTHGTIVWCFGLATAERQNFDVMKAVDTISAAFHGETHLLQVTPDELLKSFIAGHSVIGFTEMGEVVCHARLVHLFDNWWELGSTYVSPHFRGQKINHLMYQEFLPHHRDKDILATTTNPISIQVGKDCSFVTLPRRDLPSRVWQTSCTCPAQKMGTTNPHCCQLAHGEHPHKEGLCYFRVTSHTARRHGLRELSVL